MKTKMPYVRTAATHNFRRVFLAFPIAFASISILSGAQVMAQQTPIPAPGWDTFADTWVGVDGLGRVLPTFDEVGPPKAQKQIGMFYFLTFDRNQDGPYDNTKILAAHPEAIKDIHHPAWGPLNRAHYWGEPLFGYYASDDEWVLRKHAQMLVAAGVDVVVFDNSNAVTYDRARDTLCRVWEQIRREGGKTPQIAFHLPFSNWNSIGTSTLRELYDALYAPGQYEDLWFRWNGKPLIIGQPEYADPAGFKEPARQATPLVEGGTLGQSFTADRAFVAVAGEFPTWSTTDSAMTLTLRAGGPGGKVIVQRRFENVADNSALTLTSLAPNPPGKYYLEISSSKGQIGWWGYSSDVYAGGQAFEDGAPTGGDRSLRVGYGAESLGVLIPDTSPATPGAAVAKAQQLRDFFTFRSPIGPYNITAPPPNHWAWLQIYPQAPQRDTSGKPEEISVGVAQNYNATVNNTAPMSVTGAFGRSYHNGALDTRPGALRQGFNFAEQWKRALEVDPPFVFVTGWNEWTAGFMDKWVSWTAPPPIFVDEFTQEFSRDIEPMHGGHGDDYYYQQVANARRYKGVRPLPPVQPQPIPASGDFGAWAKVEPEFRDDIGDTAHRNAPGGARGLHYNNETGRNDVVAAKVSFDATNIYFYVRTHAKLTSHTDPSWMLLFLNVGADYKRGWLGYNYVLNRKVGSASTTLERHTGAAGAFAWAKAGDVHYHAAGNEMMITVPRRLLGLTNLPATIDFKWADNCLSATPTWADFTLNGDAAPNDRFNYRARLR
jgi:hypothetical protein